MNLIAQSASMLAVGLLAATLRASQRRRSIPVVIACILLMPGAPWALGQGFGPDFGDQSPSLRTLPPMRALPLGASPSPPLGATAALHTPEYCDADDLVTSATLRAVDFFNERLGIAVGDHGCVLRSSDGGQTWESVASGVECRLNDVIWLSQTHLIAIGGGMDPITRLSRGVILTSRDGGKKWNRAADEDLPQLLALRLANPSRAVIAIGQRDPISGGNRFESRDGGRSWQAVVDGDPADVATVADTLPRSGLDVLDAIRTSRGIDSKALIRCVSRIDNRSWICAGDHGVVLRSNDDGQTWQSVRGQSHGSAMLIISHRPETIPWSLLGRESMEKRLRSQVAVVQLGTSLSNARWESAVTQSALSQAAMRVGAASVDAFPSGISDSLEPTLKNLIATVGAPILVLDGDLDDSLKTTLLQFAAGTGTQKVVEYSRSRRGEALLHDNAMLPDSGVLAGDIQIDCHLLVSDLGGALSNSGEGLGLSTRYSTGGQSHHGDTLALGVRLGHGHRLPERSNHATGRRLQVLQGRLKQQTAIDNLCRLSETGAPTAEQEQRFARSLRSLLDRTSRVDQLRTAFRIAQQLIGHPQQRVVWEEIADRFPQSSTGRIADLHARAKDSSWEWNHYLEHTNDFRHAAAEVEVANPFASSENDELLPAAVTHGTVVSPFQTEPSSPSPSLSGLNDTVIQASAALPIGASHAAPSSRRPPAGTQALDLAWQMHPVRLIVQDAFERATAGVAASAADDAADSTGDDPSAIVSATASPRHSKPLSANLQRIAERPTTWSPLLREQSEQVTRALFTPIRPKLDGQLDEPFWTLSDTPAAVTREGLPARIRAAWDDLYVYLAIETPREQLRSDPRPQDIGQRDADVSDSDRVVLGLDLDRDLLTQFHLAFTTDGRTHDDLDGNDRWNPTWYVASSESEQFVTTEIAIDRSSLQCPIQSGDRWFLSVLAVAAGTTRPYEIMPSPLRRVRIDFIAANGTTTKRSTATLSDAAPAGIRIIEPR